jgi:hypothetical protein
MAKKISTPRMSAEGRYELLMTQRSPFLERARAAAKVTIPSLVPDYVGNTGSSGFITPWQSVGSRGVNNISSKLLLALLPPETPFFQLSLDQAILQEMKEQQGAEEDLKGAIGTALSGMETSVLDYIETMGIRSGLFETLKQLVVAGNALLNVREDSVRLYKLSEYVCKRDTTGNPLEIVVKQVLSPAALPKTLRKYVSAEKLNELEDTSDKSSEQTIPLFTWIRRMDAKWEIHQEIESKIVEETRGSDPLDAPSWLPLRLTRLDNEDYGRSLVEEYIGDLISLETLSQALVQGAQAAARIVYMVEQGGTVNVKALEEAPNGAVIKGNARDISVLTLEKFADFTVAEKRADSLERRLSAVFLLSSELPRDAERVTAEEIRLIANELEDTLGGVYSLFALELQLPLVKRVLANMQRQKKLPKLPKESVKPKIVTGLAALGRNHDLRKMDILASGAAMFGPEAVAEYVIVGNWLQRRAAALNIDMKGVLRSEDEVQRRREEKERQQMVQKLGPEAIKQTAASPNTSPTQ